MCLSATVSYGSATVLFVTGMYAVRHARHFPLAYRLLALVPLLFGIQQGFEGRVWQEINAGNEASARPYALAFHFFSHFLWLWWFPLCSYLIERQPLRRKIFQAILILGTFSAVVVYGAMLLNPEWLIVSVREHSLIYNVDTGYRGPIDIPLPSSAVYALIILVPLLFSSSRDLRVFGVLSLVSMVLASVFYGYALVSVWCLFAAILSLYLALVIVRMQKHGAAKGYR